MKQMMSMPEFAAELRARDAAKADFVAPVELARMNDDATFSVADSINAMPLTDIGHSQIAEFAGIPKAYYDRVKELDPMLLAHNVNRWLKTVQKDNRGKVNRRMFRTLRGSLRAVLSDRYNRIDNLAVADVVLGELSKIAGIKVVSSAITEARMYIKVVSTEIVAPDPGVRRVGSLVEAGVVIRNSETGMGRVAIDPFANFLWCLNGMVRNESKLAVAHVGGRIDEGIEGFLADDTRRLEDEVTLRKVRDVIRHAFNREAFDSFMHKLTATTQQQIEGDVPAAVEALGPTLGLTQGERGSVLKHLIEGGDLSRYGLANAVTRMSADVDSYDRATEVESLGYKLIDLGQQQWNGIANAKPLALAA